MILQLLSLLGAAALFLYGLNLMSNSLLKASGDKLNRFLPWMRKNPFSSILSGFGITAIAQSSSAATVNVVSFVNAGALTLAQSILVIMGANIGASLTTWLVAILGFKLGITGYTYIIVAIGFILTMMKSKRKKTMGEIILGFALILLGLSYMITYFPTLDEFPGLAETVLSFSASGFLSILTFMAIGCILAFLMQSTGAVTVTMIMFSMGWINLELSAAMVLGENIGTTIFANIAASEGNVSARRAAIVHTLFNVFGAVLALIFFRPLIALSDLVSCGYGVFAIATFHTLFNLLNTCILAWFVKPIEKLVTLIVAESAGDKDESRLKYISSRQFGTPSISISQAFKEVARFGDIMHKSLPVIRDAVNETDPDKFEDERMQLVHYEELSDKLEYMIAQFLNSLSTESLSEEEAEEVKVLYRVIGEFESLGDSGENISRILDRERVHNRKLDVEMISKINLMIDKVDLAYTVMNDNLRAAVNGSLKDISNAYNAEDDINETRNKLREEGIIQIERHTGNYQSLNYFLDIISELEAMGDFMINVSQSIVRNDG